MLNNFSRGAIVAAALLSAPVFAGQIDDVQSVQIRFDDLNLTSPSGRAALTARVAQAADAFCQKPSALQRSNTSRSVPGSETVCYVLTEFD